jgi:hypothetical protein
LPKEKKIVLSDKYGEDRIVKKNQKQ